MKEENIRKVTEYKIKEQELKLANQALALREKENEFQLLKVKETRAKENLLKRSITFKKIKMLTDITAKIQKSFKKDIERILGSSTLTENDWDQIKKEIDDVYPAFTEKISLDIANLTEEEIRFCCLLKIGLDTNELASLLDINTTSVDRRRSRINKKIREKHPDTSWKEYLDKFNQ